MPIRMDTDEKLLNHWGEPVIYAAKGKGGEDVIWYLIARDADLTVKDSWVNRDALSLANFYGSKDVAWLLKELAAEGAGKEKKRGWRAGGQPGERERGFTEVTSPKSMIQPASPALFSSLRRAQY